MKKKLILILVAVLVVTAGGYVGFRLARRGTDITGVTTLTDRNQVIINAKSGVDFAAGTGYLTVAEGERIHMDYDFSAGSIDVAFEAGKSIPDVLNDPEHLDSESLPAPEEFTGEGAFGQKAVSGKGSLDFDAEPGEYAVNIVNNDAIGSAKLTAKK